MIVRWTTSNVKTTAPQGIVISTLEVNKLYHRVYNWLISIIQIIETVHNSGNCYDFLQIKTWHKCKWIAISIFCTLPLGHCSFENGFCGLKHDKNTESQWLLNSGKTSSAHTGPSYDHTTFSEKGRLSWSSLFHHRGEASLWKCIHCFLRCLHLHRSLKPSPWWSSASDKRLVKAE